MVQPHPRMAAWSTPRSARPGPSYRDGLFNQRMPAPRRRLFGVVCMQIARGGQHDPVGGHVNCIKRGEARPGASTPARTAGSGSITPASVRCGCAMICAMWRLPISPTSLSPVARSTARRVKGVRRRKSRAFRPELRCAAGPQPAGYSSSERAALLQPIGFEQPVDLVHFTAQPDHENTGMVGMPRMAPHDPLQRLEQFTDVATAIWLRVPTRPFSRR